jgi:hypothetical protein
MPDGAARFRDNHLDLEPGENRTIVVAKERGSLVPETVTVGWR